MPARSLVAVRRSGRHRDGPAVGNGPPQHGGRHPGIHHHQLLRPAADPAQDEDSEFRPAGDLAGRTARKLVACDACKYPTFRLFVGCVSCMGVSIPDDTDY